ncbi:hypothetical protein SAMN04487950_1721 [Halogranum rubrum]|uniref:Uncharacterized protein n=2 Tax=Halogranum rubrum TaxID=553466 RepID=A0A1I4DX32_9EURY|nr:MULTISPECIES: hypothetical protein [Halogranum]EJN60933.1 hypothetical protein HSB1_15360 [Halogranum salarium B-1]SFK98005.1 hypothetical protein SAMN04487950_1721 [Halogranum rubrum]
MTVESSAKLDTPESSPARKLAAVAAAVMVVVAFAVGFRRDDEPDLEPPF